MPLYPVVFLDDGLLHPDNNFGEGLLISVSNGLYHCKRKKISATTSKHYHVDPDFFLVENENH